MSESCLPVSRENCAVSLIGLLLIVFTVGCDDATERVEIEGTVKLSGQEIESGRIVFVPLEGSEAPLSSSPITDGVYRVTGRRGVEPGRYRVQVYVYDTGSPDSGAALDQIAPPREVGPPLFASEDSPLAADVSSNQTIYNFELP